MEFRQHSQVGGLIQQQTQDWWTYHLVVGLRSSLKFGHVVVVCIPVCCASAGGSSALLIEKGSVKQCEYSCDLVIYCVIH